MPMILLNKVQCWLQIYLILTLKYQSSQNSMPSLTWYGKKMCDKLILAIPKEWRKVIQPMTITTFIQYQLLLYTAKSTQKVPQIVL